MELSLKTARAVLKIFTSGKMDIETEEDQELIDMCFEVSHAAGDCWMGSVLIENFD